MERTNHILLLSCLFLCSFYSCKKEDAKPAAADVFYAVTIDGFTVSFENKTTGAVAYSWDFGDGQTGTATNPTHFYTVPPVTSFRSKQIQPSVAAIL